ncbi:MAG: NUDIX domain-containing protein [Planctomycetota bacterium JB042]
MSAAHPTHQVAVFVFREDSPGPRYLLVRRHHRHEGLWRPVLGTVRPDERLEAAALREVRDETGIVHPRALIDFGFRHREQVGDLDLVDWGLGYDVGPESPEVRLGEEYREYRWLDFEEAYRTIEVDPFREAVLKLHLRLFG